MARPGLLPGLVRFPKLPRSLRPLSEWLGLLSGAVGLISLGAALIIFIASRVSPDFVCEYKDMDQVPLSAIKKGFGLLANPVGNDTQTRLLRISVKNNKSSSGAQDVKIVVADYIRTLAFVVEQDGDPIAKYTLSPSGNTSRLEVPIGYLPPHSQRVIFVGGKCLFIDFADIHAESSNLGLSESSQMGELSGIRLFVGANAEWVTILFLLILSSTSLAMSRSKPQ